MLNENITIDDFASGNLEPISDSDVTPLSSTMVPAISSSPSTPTTTSYDSEPTEKELELFKKFHASSFDPNSSMDRKKLEQLRQAAQQTGDSDENKLRSATYALQAKEPFTRDTSKTTPNTQLRQTKSSNIKQATAPASPMGGPTYYVRTGFNQYRPAVNADVSSNQQLFMKNPNPVARAVYPYVKVDSRSVRRASPAR